jgi:ribosome-associated toxin RatA of RatAB toxin-antitoxin module
MSGKLDSIVDLAADIERWPVILPHYRWVTLIDGGGDRKTVEMAARRGVIPVKWRAIQDIDRDTAIPVIRFEHIWGVTKGMIVAWTFQPHGDEVTVTIDHQFDPPWPVLGAFAADHVIGPHFVQAIAGRTLATIKGIVEGRDDRFDAAGRPRR